MELTIPEHLLRGRAFAEIFNRALHAMTIETGSVFLVIEPDDQKREEIRVALEEFRPLQILFFSARTHAIAFLKAIPVDRPVRLVFGVDWVKQPSPALQ